MERETGTEGDTGKKAEGETGERLKERLKERLERARGRTLEEKLQGSERIRRYWRKDQRTDWSEGDWWKDFGEIGRSN